MGSTNKTTNYELSQFIGTDKPSWLNDYNGDMFKIDNQMKTNATAASNAQSKADTADGKADANALAIGTLDSQINTPSTGLAATVAGNTSAIGTINGTIGNTALPTTAQTLTGAVAEVDNDVSTINTKLSNCLVCMGTDTSVNVTADGVKTVGELLESLYGQLAAYYSNLAANEYVKIIGINATTDEDTDGKYQLINAPIGRTLTAQFYDITTCPFPDMRIGWLAMYPGNYNIKISTVLNSGVLDGTVTDLASRVPTTGSFTVVLDKYKQL